MFQQALASQSAFMLSQKTFSIIIPTFNNLELLKECIDSIKQQTYKSYEVWIIDGFSTDGTREYLETLGAPFNFISEKDSGIYQAMNRGIERAQGEWLYFMGADDVLYDPKVLQTIAQGAENARDVLLGEVIFENEKSSKSSQSQLVKQSSITRKLWLKNTVHHQGVFYNHQLFKNSRYDESYAVLADYKFNITLYKRDVAIGYIDCTIAICGSRGISKKFEWSLYKEDIRLKTELSSWIFKPLFQTIGFSKFIFKRLF